MDTPPVVPSSPPVRPSQLRCTSCGYDLTGVTVGSRCPECGLEVEESIFIARQTPRTSGYAVASMVLGILSLGCFLLGPVALLLWDRARREMKKGVFASGSRGMAIAGLVLGLIGTAILLLQAAMLIIEGYWRF